MPKLKKVNMKGKKVVKAWAILNGEILDVIQNPQTFIYHYRIHPTKEQARKATGEQKIIPVEITYLP